MNGEEKFVEVHPMCRPLVCLRIVGPHHEITRGDEREFWEQVSNHARDEVHRIAHLALDVARVCAGPFKYTFPER
jgi:hypothetical protein